MTGKQIYLIFAALCACLITPGCSKEPEKADITGEWKLETVNAVPASELSTDGYGGLDIYVSFSADMVFEIFQRLNGGTSYCRYSGTYNIIVPDTATGSYSDGNSWGAEYKVWISEDGDTLVMTGDGDECIYSRCVIPEEVRSSALEVRSGNGLTPEERFL